MERNLKDYGAYDNHVLEIKHLQAESRAKAVAEAKAAQNEAWMKQQMAKIRKEFREMYFQTSEKK